MPKFHRDYTNSDITVPSTTFVYRRPRWKGRHLARHLARRPNLKYVARLTKQVLLSSSFTAGGLLAIQAAGFNLIDPISGFGAFLALTGVGLVFAEEDTQTPEEYRQFVISHFLERGETPPRWTQQVEVGQTWRHRGFLSYITKAHYKVISVNNAIARCLVINTDGKPIMNNGKAQFCKIRTLTLRYVFKLVGVRDESRHQR